VAKLRQVIESWSEAVEAVAGEEAKLSAQDVEALRSLGYVE
jgi:hypothetical protein